MNDPQPEGHMASHIGRRKFLTSLLGGAAAAWPVAARAQQPGKLRTIGFSGLSTRSAESELVAAFAQRLHELGWIANRTITIEYRWSEGRAERFAQIAAEFVRLKVEVIVASGTPLVLAAKQATSVIPIVFVGNAFSIIELAEAQAVARTLGLEFDTLEIRRPEDIAALESIK